MYFYIVTKDGYKLYHNFEGLSLIRSAVALRHHANLAGYTHFKRDTSLIHGYWVNALGDAMIASPVELDKDGNA